MPNFTEHHSYTGKLFIVEGIDGSGKSTQIKLLQKWLESKGYSVFFTEWNSSDLVRETTKLGKKKKVLTPTTFSLLHATDFADRHNYYIMPPLKAGMIVLADRYTYTAFARDVARGVHPQWVRKLYNFAARPDLSLYFKVPIETAIKRIMRARAKIKYYEAGMDMNISPDIVQSFRIFQGRVLDEYDKLVREFDMNVIDATLDIDEQQQIFRSQVEVALEGYSTKGESMPEGKKYFGDGLPYRPLNNLKGKLIAIEGTDGVGRTTQIELLRDWIELQGYAVLETGWSRSNLMSRTIESAKLGNMVDRTIFSLLYATDFADRLENEIIPALEAGFVVLADRYIYTAFARDSIRGKNKQWIEDVFGFAVIPDLVCYLKIDLGNLVPRVIESGGMNYWESGFDLHLGEDLYDSFLQYQTRMIKEFDAMTERFGFEVIDARTSVNDIQQELRSKIAPLLEKKKVAKFKITQI